MSIDNMTCAVCNRELRKFKSVITVGNLTYCGICFGSPVKLDGNQEVDMSKKAKRFNGGKVEFDDMPMLGMLDVAKVSAYGRSKYAKQNWRGEAPVSQYINCAMRHMLKYMYGEDKDAESGCTHLGHAAWNMLAAIEKSLVGKDVDDRFKYDSDVNISGLFELDKPVTHNGLTEEDLNVMEKEFSEKELDEMHKDINEWLHKPNNAK